MPWYGWLALGVIAVAAIAVAQWRGWIELRGVDAGRVRIDVSEERA